MKIRHFGLFVLGIIALLTSASAVLSAIETAGIAYKIFVLVLAAIAAFEGIYIIIRSSKPIP